MRLPFARQFQTLRRFMPRSLLGRSLLIMLVPLIVVQAVALQLFYGSNQVIVSRRLASAAAGEIATIADTMQRFPGSSDRGWVISWAKQNLQLDTGFEPAATLAPIGPASAPSSWTIAGGLLTAMQEIVHRPYQLDWTSDALNVVVRVQMTDGVLTVQVPRKRLYVSTIYIFVLWLVGSAILLFTVAAIFMRNQVRALRKLGAAAEAFGLGRDPGSIKPEGAIEIRQAATAFNRMQERVRRFLAQRTALLAGVSHDLRTPLTRLRLAVALLESHPGLLDDVAEMTADISEMDRMIDGYLAFARGEGSEQAQPTDLGQVLEDVANNARRAGADIALDPPRNLTIWLRPDAMRRAITNLVDNARRHARHVSVNVRAQGVRALEILIDDDGPGIPATQREAVFRPFSSGAAGGTGLGLTIARDIVRAHGGEILLEDSPSGGLRARIVLPV